MFPDGLLAGNETFIRMKGDDWDKETANPSVKNNKMSIPLGQFFVLLDESDESHQFRNMTLYGQDPVNSNQTIGPPLYRLLEISPPDRIINRHLAYLAYGIRNGTKLILFTDGGKTLGNVITLANEKLVSGSNERLTTLSQTGETMKLLTRSLRSIHPAIADTKRSAVHVVKMSNSDDSLTCSTGYQWDPVRSAKGNVTVTIIPGNDRKLGGWIQETWRPGKILFTDGWIRTALDMFDSDGRPVQGPAKNKSDDPSSTNDGSILWDSDKRRIISDLSPYKMSDQTISYYGFKSYEVNSSRWRFVESNVMEGGFSLTGFNFLRLNNSPLEGSFTPVDQQSTVYVASGWILPSEGLLESTMEEDLEITAHLKAIVTVNETEIVRLLGRIMRKAGDWSYVESIIFSTVELVTIANRILNSPSQLGSKPRMAPVWMWITSISPMDHDFQETVYDRGRPVSVIGSSGSISRTVYYHGRPMVLVTDVGGQLEQVTTSTYTGHLVPTPKGSSSIADRNQPCRIVFYPQNGGLHEIFDAYSLRNRWNDPDVSAWTTVPSRLWHNHPQSHSLSSVDPSVLFGKESSAAVRCYYSLISPSASMAWKWKNGQMKLIRNSPELSSTMNFTSKNKTLITMTHLPNSGELIFMTEGERFFV
ncbi:hypothetical protein DAPPUDRAFT_239551 [Daphnia pulex]|uniref:Uncharacterized protein n=1 Tax=Daphnia pulex TaxID=6669 RepID=E9G9L1_DAPPU|nr:hypothetical protein DAPPUDRAFT_239551 [Daphnia pulex]|eukprot:EFX83860.1 hypothetical protein DAPPUDRAFT_239551 [Daphnia pulex]